MNQYLVQYYYETELRLERIIAASSASKALALAEQDEKVHFIGWINNSVYQPYHPELAFPYSIKITRIDRR